MKKVGKEVTITNSGHTYNTDAETGQKYSTNWMKRFIPPDGVRGYIIKNLTRPGNSKFLIRIYKTDLIDLSHLSITCWFDKKAYDEFIRSTWTFIDILMDDAGFKLVETFLESELFEI